MLNHIWMNLPNPTEEDKQAGISLLNEYLSKGYIHRTVTEMLSLSHGTITHFYRMLANMRPLESPVKEFSGSGWMVDADFCFMNVRATGLKDQLGNFIQASKMLPAIRASAVHLGPFTDYDFNTIYAVRSLRSISFHTLDPHLPLSATDQLQAFVQAAHLLGKAVGFDLEPHVAQFAVPVITHPELFRWFKLSLDKTGLENGLGEDEMLMEDYQQKICREIHKIVCTILEQEAIDDLEIEVNDTRESITHKQQVLLRLIGKLIEHGYWPIPSQSWAGIGVPAYGSYCFEGNYARFDYRDRRGQDQSASAFHILTPYKYYTGLRANRASETALLCQPAVDYFCNIFLCWRDHFGFDFVRYDSADHIFDSIIDMNRPASDRPTPPILRACVKKLKCQINHISAILLNEWETKLRITRHWALI